MRGAKHLLALPLALVAALAGGAAQSVCGPFTDVPALLCPYVFELFALGITAGTSPTTFSPESPITRGQAAVFVAKGLDQALTRSNRRAALGQWWTTTPRYTSGLGITTLDPAVGQPCSDGSDIWVPSENGSIWRVRASDGKVLGAWSGTGGVTAALCAMGRVFVVGNSGLFLIDPRDPPGPLTPVTTDLGLGPQSIAFDGNRIWTANPVGSSVIEPYPPGSISIVTPGTWTVETLTAGFEYPSGIVFDGSSMWITDHTADVLRRLDSSGAVVQTVPTGISPGRPVFDGSNIWVPSMESPFVTVVRAATGEVVATLAGGGHSGAFDGKRILFVSEGGGFGLWNAQDLSPIASSALSDFYGSGACSDGINFWLTLNNRSFSTGYLARF